MATLCDIERDTVHEARRLLEIVHEQKTVRSIQALYAHLMQPPALKLLQRFPEFRATAKSRIQKLVASHPTEAVLRATRDAFGVMLHEHGCMDEDD
jgi:hypothetical protein